ncbi:hypothetical protein RHGRI_018575 [Rhododendron griersonianum]|uniref:F-box domain-containing protein n=1 Tax=Rhododendron griersonianum TaxID=479676 RepID=A0AAV6K236_9ERIC|nr:hypothetical protein RHGRI_018575 [Rhododendron griersonianum]
MRKVPPAMDSRPPKRLQRPPTVPQTLTSATTATGDIEQDRISNLPDAILSHILSKLPTKTAIATVVLSTEWKHLFASILNLSLVIDDVLNNPPNPIPISSISYNCRFVETYVLSICSPSLKFLTLNDCNDDDFYEVSIDTPLLEVLIYDDHVASSYLGMNLNSLLIAYIDVGPSDYMVEYIDDEAFQWYVQNVAELVAACCNVGLLYLSNLCRGREFSKHSLVAIHYSSYAMPIFHYLTQLKLGDLNVRGWVFLPRLLESAPNLKTLIFTRGFTEHKGCFTKFESSISNSVPMCLSPHLRSIYFEEFNGEQDELELVFYFLKTAEVLREMKFSFCSSLPIEKQHITWSKITCKVEEGE